MNDFAELYKYVAIVLKHWWLVLLAMVVGLMAGYGITLGQTAVYEATVTILVGQSIQATELDSRDIQTSELLALTYANIARRQPILQGVVEKLNLPENWLNLKGRTSVEIVNGTQLLEITVESGSPDQAQMIANAIANELIQLSPTALQNQEAQEIQTFMRQQLDSLRTKIADGQSRLSTLQETSVESLSLAEMNELQSEINSLQRLITDWENSYTQLLVSMGTQQSPNYLTIIEPALAKSSPVRPQVPLSMIVASLIGGIAAVIGIFIFDQPDNLVKPNFPRQQGKSDQAQVIFDQHQTNPLLWPIFDEATNWQKKTSGDEIPMS